MQKTRFLLLCLSLCLLLSACGGKTESEPRDKKSEPSAPTLWGKQLSFAAVPVPEAALLDETVAAVALAPDGEQLLCAGFLDGPYLYRLQTGAVTKVIPGDEYAEEYLRGRLKMAILMGKTAEEIQVYLKDHPELETISGAELMQRVTLAFSARLTATSCAPRTEGNYLVVWSGDLGTSCALDCDTGKLYIPTYPLTCVGVTGDRLICYQTQLRDVTLRDVRTGTEEKLDFSFAVPEADSAHVQGAAALPDGSLCAVVGGDPDVELGQPIALGILGPDGEQQTIDLGRGYCSGSYSIVAADDSSILICPEYRTVPYLYLVRRDTAQVSLLWSGSDETATEILSAPLAECVNDVGFPDLADRADDRAVLRAVGLLSDGKTVILYDSTAGCPVLLFRPEQMQAAPLLEGVSLYLPLMRALTGNGYDLWMDSQSDRGNYYRLTVGADAGDTAPEASEP